MSTPRLLDLYCGGGGAAMGYYRAGFEPVGIDNRPQPRYPFEFCQMDALAAMECLLVGDYIETTQGNRYYLSDFASIHASPPCQAYSIMRNLPWLRNNIYPKYIDSTRELLVASGFPWVIENVMGAKLPAGWLCGIMFGRPFYRHRAFETNLFWLAPGHPRHQFSIRSSGTLGSRARDIIDPKLRTQALRSETRQPTMQWGLPRILENADSRGVAKRGAGYGHTAGGALVREAMEIDWMTRAELTQAIPPVYTEYIGGWLMRALT